MVSSDFVHVQGGGECTRNGGFGVLLRGCFNWVDQKEDKPGKNSECITV